ncbi:recombination protein RecR [Candidatus Dojkabacteria bacterium]|nr:recombination protein RecR [Candidatus Dojkabacteria bacterium]
MSIDVIRKTVEQLKRLPGVGEKTAERFAYFYLRAPKEEAIRLAEYLKEMVNNTVTCKICFNKASSDPCSICASTSRDKTLLCVVENYLDVLAIEKTGIYNGYYFVLGGIIDPANGVGPDELLFDELAKRIEKAVMTANSVEIIFAFTPSLNGEATINYALKEISKKQIKGYSVSKLAQGLPTGADLQYADSNTIQKALLNRMDV